MNIGVFFRKNGPLLFTIGAGVTLVGAVVTAFRAGFVVAADTVFLIADKDEITEKAEARKKENNPAYNERLDEELKKDIFDINCKHVVRWVKECLLPLGLTGASLFCMYKGQKLNTKALAAMGAGYAALQKKGGLIESKVKQYIGQYKEEEFEEDVAQDWITGYPLPEDGAIMDTGNGNDLFFDSFSERYFLSSLKEVEQAIDLAKSDLNRGGKRYGLVLNDWYRNYLGIKTIGLGGFGGYFFFDKEKFDKVKIVPTACPDRSVSPYCYVINYPEGAVDTIYDRKD